ncbi:unnamed protein product [Lampetra fluviatilis]
MATRKRCPPAPSPWACVVTSCGPHPNHHQQQQPLERHRRQKHHQQRRRQQQQHVQLCRAAVTAARPWRPGTRTRRRRRGPGRESLRRR